VADGRLVVGCLGEEVSIGVAEEDTRRGVRQDDRHELLRRIQSVPKAENLTDLRREKLVAFRRRAEGQRAVSFRATKGG
jgi:hypothetical protein